MSGTVVKNCGEFRAALAEPSSFLFRIPRTESRLYSAGVAMPVETWTTRLRLRVLNPDDLDIVHPLFSSRGHTVGDGPVADPGWTANGWSGGSNAMRRSASRGTASGSRVGRSSAPVESFVGGAAMSPRSGTRSAQHGAVVALRPKPPEPSQRLHTRQVTASSGRRSVQRTSHLCASCNQSATTWSGANLTARATSTTTSAEPPPSATNVGLPVDRLRDEPHRGGLVRPPRQ